MPPRKSTGPETDAEKVVEAIQVLSGTVEHASQQLEMIGDELSRIRDDLKWICNEQADVFRLINRLPLDPASKTWAGQLKAMNAQRNETIFCTTCDAPSPRSLSEALRAGWTCLIDDEGNERGDFAGHCPGCSAEGDPTGQEQLEYLLSCTECEAEASLTEGLLNGWTGVSAHEDGFVGRCPEHEVEHGPSAVEPQKVLLTPAKSSAGEGNALRQPVIPPSPVVQSKLAEGTTVQCDVCDRQVSTEEAKREKWTDVARWKGGGLAAWLGICPGCIGGESEKAKPAKPKSLFE